MLDIYKFCRANSIEYRDTGHSHCRPGWVQLQCPQCGTRGTHGGWYLGFNLARGNFNCWRCGSIRFWTAIEGILRAPRSVCYAAVSAAQREDSHQPREVVQAQPRLKTLKPPPGLGPMLAAHRKYLTSRNFDPDEIARVWEAQGTGPTGGVWAWRVVFPVKNKAGRIVAYNGRAIGERNPLRYKMTEDAKCLEDPHTFVYGIDKALGDAVLIVEGPTGAWRFGPGCVATLGIDFKRAQTNVLRKFERRYILFDPEPAAQKRARQLAEQLSIFGGTTEILTGFATDPGEFSPKEAALIRRELLL